MSHIWCQLSRSSTKNRIGPLQNKRRTLVYTLPFILIVTHADYNRSKMTHKG